MNIRLQIALRENSGFITVAQGKKAGLSHTSILRAAKAGFIERVAHGVYSAADEFYDVLYANQLRRPRAIYSHGTALFLHDLTDRDPISLSVTVPKGYNTRQLLSEGLAVFSVKKELYEIGIAKMLTKYDHTVISYCAERTICDCIRSRSRMDAEVVADAVKRYARRSDRDINSLMKMAAMFGVEKILQGYLEALL